MPTQSLKLKGCSREAYRDAKAAGARQEALGGHGPVTGRFQTRGDTINFFCFKPQCLW